MNRAIVLLITITFVAGCSEPITGPDGPAVVEFSDASASSKAVEMTATFTKTRPTRVAYQRMNDVERQAFNSLFGLAPNAGGPPSFGFQSGGPSPLAPTSNECDTSFDSYNGGQVDTKSQVCVERMSELQIKLTGLAKITDCPPEWNSLNHRIEVKAHVSAFVVALLLTGEQTASSSTPVSLSGTEMEEDPVWGTGFAQYEVSVNGGYTASVNLDTIYSV